MAGLTILGFVFSRTAGFPKLEDHVGEWDTLGVVSLLFEGAIVVSSMAVLARQRFLISRRSAILPTLWVAALVGLVVMVPAAPTNEVHHRHPAATHEIAVGLTKEPVLHGRGVMWGDMRPYPQVQSATLGQRARVTLLWRETRANARRFESYADARRLGYVFMRSAIAQTGYPAVFHARKRGGQFWGRLLDPTAPQALMYWCTSRKRCTLVGFVYRAPREPLPPRYECALVWHRAPMDASWMTHVWLADGLRSALALHAVAVADQDAGN